MVGAIGIILVAMIIGFIPGYLLGKSYGQDRAADDQIEQVSSIDVVQVTRCRNCHQAIPVNDTTICCGYYGKYKSINGFCDEADPEEE